MAWTIPTTRSTNDLITASHWNTDLVDNLVYLYNGHHATSYASGDITGAGAGTWSGAVTFTAERHDTDGYWSSASAQKMIVPAGYAGTYFVYFSGTFAATAGLTAVGSRIKHNGSTVLAEDVKAASGTTFPPTTQCKTYPVNVAAGDYFTVEIIGYGATPVLKAYAQYSPNFSVIRIGS